MESLKSGNFMIDAAALIKKISSGYLFLFFSGFAGYSSAISTRGRLLNSKSRNPTGP
jgi:hypothetical protein